MAKTVGFKRNIDQAAGLYAQGMSLKQVAEHFGVSRQAVNWHFKSARIPLRNPGAHKRQRA